jgi:hypothetical protein
MDLAMKALNFEVMLIYLDDIIVFSQTIEEHLVRLRLLFDRLRSANLKLKPSKCRLLQEEVTFLGHVVSAAGVATDPEKTRAVEEWDVPRNVHEVRSFLGLCGYYRRFIENFAAIARPLHDLTSKNAVFHWDGQCQKAFETLKARLLCAPILGLPREEGRFILDTDASDTCIGAVLSQVQDGEERVIAYGCHVQRETTM